MASKKREGKPASPPRDFEREAAKRAASTFEAAAARLRRTVDAQIRKGGKVADVARAMLEELDKAVDEKDLERWSHEFTARMGAFAARQVSSQLQTRVDLSLPKATHARLAAHAVATMRGIPRALAERVTPIVVDAIKAGARGESFAADIAEATGIERKAASKKAVGLAIRANAELTKQQHIKAGVKEYRWRASPDKYTRKWHRKLDNTVHRYDEPPMGGGGGPHDTGHPGSADTCRCQAIPILPPKPSRSTPSG
jgi:SPP1 gp7 family putative phage head morphogenesis protein